DYVGRIDAEVKVRGHRIELGEIQAALLQLPIVIEAAVITRTDEQGQAAIYAYMVTKEQQPANESDVRAFLKTKLPDFML
ncbi:hypothetical protein MMJ63_25735, partial [Bacillus vallismortis]|nr:hypothetical protein [Bacillus vallismortis]